MKPQEIQILSQACRMAGIDAGTITPENPFSKSGKVAGLIQAAVSEIAPEQAARWRVDAGGSLSVATLAEMQSGEPLSEAAMNDLWNHDPAFVVDRQKEQQQQEQAVIQQMEKRTAELRLKNTMRQTNGNETEARRVIEAEDANEAKRQEQQQVAAQHARELEQRLAQQRNEARRMSGVLS